MLISYHPNDKFPADVQPVYVTTCMTPGFFQDLWRTIGDAIFVHIVISRVLNTSMSKKDNLLAVPRVSILRRVRPSFTHFSPVNQVGYQLPAEMKKIWAHHCWLLWDISFNIHLQIHMTSAYLLFDFNKCSNYYSKHENACEKHLVTESLHHFHNLLTQRIY